MVIGIASRELNRLSRDRVDRPVLLPSRLDRVLTGLSMDPSATLQRVSTLVNTRFASVLIRRKRGNNLYPSTTLRDLLSVLDLRIHSLFRGRVRDLLSKGRRLLSILINFRNFLTLTLRSTNAEVPGQ